MILRPDLAWTGPSFPYDSPRDWQAEALPIAVEALEADERTIVRAIMGSGKASFAAELCYISAPELERETIVVSVPTRNLVRQLSETIAKRIGAEHVGAYFTGKKEAHAPIVVVCLDSLPSLFLELREAGKRVALWIADEVHRTETPTVDSALEILEPERAIGLTATPFTGSGGLSRWSRIAYRYTTDRALSEGVIVPWKLEHWTGNEVGFDIACLELAKRGAGIGPGIINATDIADAERFSELAHEFGISVDVVHSERSDTENEAAIAALERGELEAVVHVAMLQEGIDLPWLRWILLRRNTQSRVRFAQEVGRVLRASPGKEFATIFDPLDLFSAYKLTLDAVLSGGRVDKVARDVSAIDEAADELFDAIETTDGGDFEKTIAALDPTESYLRRVIVALDAAGILDQKVAPKRMREEPPTEAQLRYVAKLRKVITDRDVVPNLPDRHREILAFAHREAWRMNKGVSSDLISILKGLRTAHKWPELAGIMV